MVNKFPKVGYFISHPIQYQVPLQRLLAAGDLNFKTFYFSDDSVRQNSFDPEFRCAVKWDVPLLTGYPYEFLSKRSNEEFKNFKIPDPESFFEREKLDAVLIHGYAGGFVPQLLKGKRKYHYKIILRGEFTEWTEFPRPLPKQLLRSLYLRWLYPQIDAFGAIGECAKEHLTHFKVPLEKVFFTPYSVDDAMFAEQKRKLDRGVCRNSLGIAERDIVFLFSGKLIPRKRSLLMGKALKNCLKQNPHAKAIFLGTGIEEASLRELLKDEIASGHALLPGFVNQSELGQYFRASDVFILPSLFDAWGLVVNEAMHFGLPVIVSDNCCCSRDLVKEGVTGLVFETDNEQSLTQCMMKYLQVPACIHAMGKNAEKLIEKYMVRKTADGILEAIEYVMKEKR